MKPRNFPGHRLRRQARTYHRLPFGAQSHEKFVLHGVVPINYIEQPTDIRIRAKAGDRRKLGAFKGGLK